MLFNVRYFFNFLDFNFFWKNIHLFIALYILVLGKN